MIDTSDISVRSGPYCPKCGDRLVPTIIATNPPSQEYKCFKCGKTFTELDLLSQLITTIDIDDSEPVFTFDKDAIYNVLKDKFEGCELCKGAKYLSCTLCSEKPYRGGILVTEIRDDDGGAVDIEYCPVCGRPLTDESLMKLAEKLSNILEDKLE